MKLASALAERSDLQNRLNVLRTRLNNNAKVQEGETPAEDPALLLRELDEDTARLEQLIAAINMTNSMTLADGRPVTMLLARRDALRLKAAALRTFLDTASARVDRYARTEIRILSTVDVPALQKQADDLSRELREVDEKIQEINWTTELME